MTETVDVPVLFFHNRQDNTWTYMTRHPSLMGGPFDTLLEAEEGAVRGMCAVLHSDSWDDEQPEATVGHLRVTVAVAPVAVSAAA